MKTRRIYRLRTFLAHTKSCEAWQGFARGFKTADQVLAAVNAEPGAPIPDSVHGRAWSLRYHAARVAGILGDDAWEWWDERVYAFDRHASITPEEADGFRALWVRYADAHGLYEDVPVDADGGRP